MVAAKPGVGVRELLDLVVRLLPAPETRAVKGVDLHGTEVERRADAAAPFCAQVFRTTIDHFAGRVDYLRVLSGTLRPEATVMNPRTRSEERVSRLFRTDGAQTVEIPAAGPGDVVVLLKLKDARTGDTLCDKDAPIVLPDFRQPNRPVAYAIQAKGEPTTRRPPPSTSSSRRIPPSSCSAIPTPGSSSSRRWARPTSRSPSSG